MSTYDTWIISSFAYLSSFSLSISISLSIGLCFEVSFVISITFHFAPFSFDCFLFILRFLYHLSSLSLSFSLSSFWSFSRFDGTSTSNILLDTEDGRCTYRILLNRQEHFCPFFLLLRCLAGNLSLSQLKIKILEGTWSDTEECIELNNLMEELWGQEPAFADSDVLENRVSPHNELYRLLPIG